MKHKMMLNNSPFYAIKSGTKVIEMRLCDEKRKLIKIGDEIEFTNRENGEKLPRRVCNLTKFKDFEDLYRCFNKVSLGYLENEDAKHEDMSKYYTKEEIQKYGVLAIEIEIM